MHKILLLEPIHPVGTDYLRAHDCEAFQAGALDEPTLLEQVKHISGIIVRTRGRVSRKLMQAAPGLKVIGRHGVGVENIEVEAATELGIWVVNTPQANAGSVAEHFIALALMVARKIPSRCNALRTADWRLREGQSGQEISGKTVGIIGFGRIGKAIARICHHGFQCPVLFCDPKENQDPALAFAQRVDLVQLLERADIVSINVPLNSKTEKFFNSECLSQMKRTAFLINTSNGKLWDEDALYVALAGGGIAGAATDVFQVEPTSPDNPLLQLDTFVATPHIAAQTEPSLRRMAMVAEDVVRVVKGGAPRFPVNSIAQPRSANGKGLR
jgi:D-3-phosphoglycerate dehydrogenase